MVASVKRVTDIMGEITYASQAQTIGIERINQAITRMDDVPHKIAALVEKATAAVESRRHKATDRSRVFNIFTIGAKPKMAGIPTPIVGPEHKFAAKRALSHRFSNV